MKFLDKKEWDLEDDLKLRELVKILSLERILVCRQPLELAKLRQRNYPAVRSQCVISQRENAALLLSHQG